MSTRSLCLLLPVLLVTLVSACGGGGGLPNALIDCPEDSTVTWAEAGPLFASNCTSCHSVDKSGPERAGAEEGVDYDNADVAYNSPATTADRSWYRIYDGSMPPSKDVTVPDDEALIIHEWLSCGGPE